MSRLLLSCGALLLVLVSGCGEKKTERDATSEHSEYVRVVEQKLTDLDAKIDTLKVHIQNGDEKMRTEAREDLAALDQQRERVRLKLDELRGSAEATWDQTRIGLVTDLDSLDAKFDRARARLH